MRAWVMGSSLVLLFGVAGCVAPATPRGRTVELSFRGAQTGSQHPFGARVEVSAILTGQNPGSSYNPLWTNVHTGESQAKWAIQLVLDEPAGQNEYTFTATGPTGEKITERLVFLTQVELDPLPPRDPVRPQATPARSPSPRTSHVQNVLDPEGEAFPPSEPISPRDLEPEAFSARPGPSLSPSPAPAPRGSPPPRAAPSQSPPPARVVSWKLHSVIYNATVLTADQQVGRLAPPLQEGGAFKGVREGDLWSGTIEDQTFGSFEFESKQAEVGYQGQIRFRGTEEWVPLAITKR